MSSVSLSIDIHTRHAAKGRAGRAGILTLAMDRRPLARRMRSRQPPVAVWPEFSFILTQTLAYQHLGVVWFRVFNSGREKKSVLTDKTEISGIWGFFIFIFIFIFIFYVYFFNLFFSGTNIQKINFGR